MGDPRTKRVGGGRRGREASGRARRRIPQVVRGVGALGPALAAGVLHAGLARTAGAQDLRYSVTPLAQQIAWNDALGLDNTFMYGGRLGFVFGKRIELQGFYLTNQGSDAGVRDLYDRLGVADRPPQNAGLGVQNYGALLVYNFAVGGFTPFVRAGGSILRFEPEGARRSDRIALQYGGGLRFGKPGAVRLNLFVDDVRFRVDRTLLLALPVTPGAPPVADPDRTKLRGNLAYGAGVTFPLGRAAAYDDAPQYRLSSVALPVEVFAGRLQFAEASGLPAQNLVGVRTGLDFGQLVGLRAFYWQGVNDDFRRSVGLRSFGAEAQFSLNAGPGINPFLLAGAGQLDFRESYRDVPADGGQAFGAVPDDRTALILGGGVRVPLGTRLVLTGAARNYLASRDGRTEDVSESGQLRGNWQYTAGFSFGLGGRRARRQTAARPDTVFIDRTTGRRVESAGEVELAESPKPRTVAVTARGDTLRGAAADSALAAEPGARRVEVRNVEEARGAATPARGYASDRTVEVVVPTEGEINIRYGPAAPVAPGTVVREGAAPRDPALGGDALREAVREAVREELGAPRATGTTVVPPPPGTTFLREIREVDRPVVREYRDEGGRVIRQYRDDRGRVVREYRGRDGRVVREYPRTSVAPAPVPPPAPANVRAGEGEVAAERAYDDRAPRAAAPGGAPLVLKESAGEVAEFSEGSTESRVLARLDSIERALAAGPREGAAPRTLAAEDVRAIVREELARAPRAAAPRADTAVVARTTVDVRTQPARRTPYYESVQGGLLYSGATLSGGAQGLAGVRIDLGALTRAAPGFRLVPEVAFGFGGGGTSTYVAANGLYEFGGPAIGRLGRIRPRVSLGAGLLNFSRGVGGRDGTDVVLTPAYGASLGLPALRGFGGVRSPELVVEHQGVDFFDVNRLVVGLGWRR